MRLEKNVNKEIKYMKPAALTIVSTHNVFVLKV